MTATSPQTALLLTFARRGEEDMIAEAMAVLRDAAPGAHLLAVGTPASEPALRRAGLDDILLYGDGRGARALLADLRARRPGLAAVVYWDSSFAGHLKLEALALLAGPARVLRLAPGVSARTLLRGALLRSVLAKSLQAAGLLAGAAVLCGLAYAWLRFRQIVAGGLRANRT
jgi:hypothetical protein